MTFVHANVPLFKIAHSRTLFSLSSVFSSKHYIFYNTGNVKNVHAVSIRSGDLNPQPLQLENPPMTIGPGLHVVTMVSYNEFNIMSTPDIKTSLVVRRISNYKQPLSDKFEP